MLHFRGRRYMYKAILCIHVSQNMLVNNYNNSDSPSYLLYLRTNILFTCIRRLYVYSELGRHIEPGEDYKTDTNKIQSFDIKSIENVVEAEHITCVLPSGIAITNVLKLLSEVLKL